MYIKFKTKHCVLATNRSLFSFLCIYSKKIDFQREIIYICT